MGSEQSQLSGPDFTQGVSITDLDDGVMLLGHASGEPVLMVRRGAEVFAIGATCTHYGGPLAEGVLEGDSVHCPWHHACFSVRTGEALRAPALNPVACWPVECRDGKAYVTRKVEREPLAPTPNPSPRSGPSPKSIVIVGGGAAGNAAAEMLRREGYDGRLTVIDADADAPYDRPNLSKDYLAGNAPEEWLPLRPPGFDAEHGIAAIRGRVASLDPGAKHVTLEGGAVHAYDRLLLSTGASPVRLPTPGADGPTVFYLRSLADSRAIVAAATRAKKAVVIGSSFIGLEVAASLRARELEVHVVAPESRPFEKVLGRELGAFIQRLHEEHGVVFHLRHTATAFRPGTVVLDDGQTLEADLVVIGVGVRPNLSLAEEAGLATDRGISVSEQLETSVAGIFAAGDIVRWPDSHTGQRIRVEHWVVAEQQGQVAARNLLGAREPFRAAPFFWSAHYDVTIAYVGHATEWDRVDIQGNIEDRDCVLAYRSGGKTLAVASIFRDKDSLTAAIAMERGDSAVLRSLAASR
ncbi:MAG TPA: FAD-dependent oxidoreductase [Gemmatimonadaceae bacterium]|jgi:NADPH-dependent 2,4-dienoyl-CoA reductase/sulfur reductase-like enzyme/nitrite reductase/ring-hydroxylating ferredoxin subunit